MRSTPSLGSFPNVALVKQYGSESWTLYSQQEKTLNELISHALPQTDSGDLLQ